MEEIHSPEVVHSSCGQIRERLHTVLVRPEYGGNVGSTARAIANMGLKGSLRIVGKPTVLDASAWRMAKHAKGRLESALWFDSLKDALRCDGKPLILASTARIGSANRPHPVAVQEAVPRALGKLLASEVTDIFLVFGPEADGLDNDDIALCDWVVSIPSSEEYRSLNLAQAVLVFSYEVNRFFATSLPSFQTAGRSQRERLVAHFLGLAEAVGFVLPGDPYKMRPRLEEILSQLPPYIDEVNTLHGLLDQAIRSVKAGAPDFKGRYRNKVETVLSSRET
ncbi:hypothetical protein K2X33_07775 [bacterium]|nr:hypothetical protein [bacterium]